MNYTLKLEMDGPTADLVLGLLMTAPKEISAPILANFAKQIAVQNVIRAQALPMPALAESGV